MSAAIDYGENDKGRKVESRASQYRSAGIDAPFVELDSGQYFFNMLIEAGPVKSAPMGGAMGLEWVDIAAYLVGYPVEVEHSERVLLHRMSQSYAVGLQEGANPFSIPPVEREMKD